jgi:hypothetical protein
MSVPSEDAARVLHTLTSFETHPTKSHGFDCFLIGRDP